MVIPGMTIISSIGLAVVKNLFTRMAKPDKIADYLVDWFIEIAAKDDKKDWKDRLSKFLDN